MAKDKVEKAEKKKKKTKAADGEQMIDADTPGTSGRPKRDPRELCSIIAKPMADAKMLKKLLKLTKKAAKRKQLKLGVKEVIKAVRKDVAGICVIAGDISPVDVISPLPVLCEDHDIPYMYVPSKEELGHAGMTKRSASCVLVLDKPVKGPPSEEDAAEFAELFADVKNRVAGQRILYNVRL